jgi:hypothetical protein
VAACSQNLWAAVKREVLQELLEQQAGLLELADQAQAES